MLPVEELPTDASTLIYLAKADTFAEAEACVGRMAVPPSVWREAVDAGERLGYPDVPRIRAAEQVRILGRVELTASQQDVAAAIAAEHRLGVGESEVLALATSGGRALVDEGRAARAAHALGIVPVSTLFLPVLGRRRRALSTREATDLLRKLAIVTGARAEVVFELELHIRKEGR
jgi:predicted nucleic acid-binding protein